ncbi:activated CDC42 kinase 1-like [Halichondria panicea]|uniref:activated CDC42 kinase 1-like n=1 Tax=Halichondria panicea TaxID=6063 RepID=UPI00312B83CA
MLVDQGTLIRSNCSINISMTDIDSVKHFDIHECQLLFVESPSEDNFCSQCKKILKEPMLTECCGAHLCKVCAEPNIQNNKLLTCPACEQTSVACILDKPKWKKILDLKVICPMHVKGCQWTGDIKNCHDHLIGDCVHTHVECGEERVDNNIAEKCQLCGEYDGRHNRKCPNRNFTCPNGCGECFKFEHFDEHMSICSECITRCEFEYAGCDVVLKRKQILDHRQKSIQKHSHLILTFIHGKRMLSRFKFEDCEKINETKFMQQLRDKKMIKKNAKQSKSIDFYKEEISDIINKTEEILNISFQYRENTVKKTLAKLPGLFWELDPDTVQLDSKLVSGQFNEIWKGQQYGKYQIAIKMHKVGSMTSSKFLGEASVLRDFDHINIIQLCGVCTKKEPYLIVTEYMMHGNLANYLKSNGKALTQKRQVDIIRQVASGMSYLERLNCIHRGITSHAVLVSNTLQFKIGSFSLAKILKQGETEYKVPQGERSPVKWSAPEVLIESKCTTKSDVWSFGIVQYEIITKRVVKMSNSKAETFITRGPELDRPLECPEHIHQVILQCMSRDPTSRPSFSVLSGIMHTKLFARTN